jgi:hypothetical protein
MMGCTCSCRARSYTSEYKGLQVSETEDNVAHPLSVLTPLALKMPLAVSRVLCITVGPPVFAEIKVCMCNPVISTGCIFGCLRAC